MNTGSNRPELETRVPPAALGEALLEQDAKANLGVPTPEIDRVQEEVMAAISPDGRPPHRRTRIAEWKWFIIGASLLCVAGVIWATLTADAWPAVIFVGTLICISLAAASPAWGAGLLRRGEEREARKVALIQAHRHGPL